MRRFSLILAALLALVLSCSNDPEGPVSAAFIDDGTFGVNDGPTTRIVIPVNATTVSVPTGVGGTGLLTLGRERGIDYEAILIRFNIAVSAEDAAKTVKRANFHFPLAAEDRGARTDRLTDSLGIRIPATIHQLFSSFNDAESITSIPAYDPSSIADSLGRTDYTLSLKETEYSVDTALVNAWMTGRRPHNGIAIVPEPVLSLETTLDSTLDMHAREYGNDPPALRVYFTDGTSAVYASVADYSIVTFHEAGLNVVGGVSTRVYFTFAPVGIPTRAILHAAFLVTKTRGDAGMGATLPERLLLGFSTDFFYHLYTPASADTLALKWLSGTEVDRGSFDPTASETVRLNLRGFMADVLRGARANTGLVLETDKPLRIQRASFVPSGADAPYIEIVYSMPASFGGPR